MLENYMEIIKKIYKKDKNNNLISFNKKMKNK